MKTHTVQKGDTLWKISKMHGISLEALIAANPQITNPDMIDAGMQVNIPDGGAAPAVPLQAPAPTTPVEEVMGGAGEAIAPPAPAAEMGFPSAAKWDGLWKYVVKHGDSMHKIAKQVGVTLDQLKAANPQIANPETIFPNQVLNIPASGMKTKSVNPGLSLKEQMTAPIGMQPLVKEQLTKPKEMAPMAEFTKPLAFVPPVAPLPVSPMPVTPMSPVELNANLQLNPHVDIHPNIDVSPKTNVTVSPQWQIASPHAQLGQNYQQPMGAMVNTTPAAPMHPMAPMPQVVSPAATMPAATGHYPMMMYIPVTVKKVKKKKCHHKKHKCGCHHKHHHHHGQMMMMYYPHMMHQAMPGLTQTQAGVKVAKTFYRDED